MLDFLQQDPWGFLQFMAYRAPAVLLALTLHELAHGYVAYVCGDPTARDAGRLTLNPLRHLDLFGTLGMFLMGVGWAKPVPVNPANFHNPRADDIKVSLAGVTTNLILFLFATLVTLAFSKALYKPEVLAAYGTNYLLNFQSEGFSIQLFPQYDQAIRPILRTPWLLHLQRFFFHLSMVNLGMGLFNLLPIPPLDGFHVVNQVFFRGKIFMGGTFFRFTHLILMIVLMTTNIIGSLVGTAIDAVQGAVLSLLLPIFGA